MPRPCKKRQIQGLPRCSHFKPVDSNGINTVTLSLDEYETIRLMDLEGLNQSECAEKMQVARSTVQSIYQSARKKMAQFLVMQCDLKIEGGLFSLDEKKENKKMRIAIPFENGEVFQHFGHTQQFKMYNIMNQQITSSMIVDTEGQGHGALASFLRQNQVDILICGGIGQGAKDALRQVQIHVLPGVNGNADDAVQAYLNGNLNFNPDTRCDHHDHEGHEECGHHDCHCHD